MGDLLFSVPANLRVEAEQIDEDADLGAENGWDDGRRDVIDGTMGVAFADPDVVGKGSNEDDGRVGRAFSLADERSRFQAVHARHVDVEQNDREVVDQ